MALEGQEGGDHSVKKAGTPGISEQVKGSLGNASDNSENTAYFIRSEDSSMESEADEEEEAQSDDLSPRLTESSLDQLNGPLVDAAMPPPVSSKEDPAKPAPEFCCAKEHVEPWTAPMKEGELPYFMEILPNSSMALMDAPLYAFLDELAPQGGDTGTEDQPQQMDELVPPAPEDSALDNVNGETIVIRDGDVYPQSDQEFATVIEQLDYG